MSRIFSVVVLVVIAGLLWAPPAFAAVDKPGNGYTLRVSQAPDGRPLVMRWNPCQPRRAITYRVDVRMAADPAAAVADVRKSFTVLGEATGFHFIYKGQASFIPRDENYVKSMPRDAEIIVAWVKPGSRKFSSSLLGVNPDGSLSAGTGGQQFLAWQLGNHVFAGASRGFVVVNADTRLEPGFTTGASRGGLLLHELAHVMGLGHVSDTKELMYPVMNAALPASYQSGDLRGLRRVGAAAVDCSLASVKRKWTDPTNVLHDISS